MYNMLLHVPVNTYNTEHAVTTLGLSINIDNLPYFFDTPTMAPCKINYKLIARVLNIPLVGIYWFMHHCISCSNNKYELINYTIEEIFSVLDRFKKEYPEAHASLIQSYKDIHVHRIGGGNSIANFIIAVRERYAI